MKKSKIKDEEFELLFDLVMEKISIIPDEKIKKHINHGIKIMKDIDIKDSPFIACALSIPNEGIWTEDKHFNKQNQIKVWNTKDLIKYL